MKTKTIPANERPKPGQIAAMTVLLGLAIFPFAFQIKAQILIFIFFLLCLRTLSLRYKRLTPSRLVLFALTLLAVINVIWAYRTLSGQEGGTALLISMFALKLFEMRRIRDIRSGTSLFGFLLVAQFLTVQSPWLAIYLGMLLIADFALMVDLTARTEEAPLARAMRKGLSLSLQAVPLILVLFLLFPRLNAPLWDLHRDSEKGLTGMDDTLRFGALSELVLNRSLAFRASFDGEVPAEDALYWRGPVAWRTDGWNWEPARRGDLDSEPAPLVEGDEPVSYSVLLEPSGKTWLFALDLPVTTPRDGRITADYQVIAKDKVNKERFYKMTSALSYKTAEISDAEWQLALSLPDNVTERTRALVERLRGEASDDNDYVKRVLWYIRTEPFYYTLSPPVPWRNPIDQFLFDTQRGFCEHYAASFALLMRLGGIPSRIVMGYFGGEVNPLTDYLIVRQSDAHAWVEVWLEGSGWQRVDPTAAVDPSRIESPSELADLASGVPLRFRSGNEANWLHSLRLFADAIDTTWRRWVVDYSTRHQEQLLKSLGLAGLREYALVAGMIILAALALGISVFLLGRLERRDPLRRVYERFVKRLARLGIERRASEGPVALTERATTERPDLAEGVRAFARLYVPLRYGPNRVNKKRLVELSLLLERIK